MIIELDKQSLADEGLNIIRKFCDDNSIVQPDVRFIDKTHRWYKLNSCGFFREDKGIVLMTNKCSHVGTTGRSWSWPGYIIDRTPYGVLAHELGHHVHCKVFMWQPTVMHLSRERRLTNYCPNHLEWFAEMFRLFITNPDLLRLVRPRTYKLFSAAFKPSTTESWCEVLSLAPDRIMNAASNHVRKESRNV